MKLKITALCPFTCEGDICIPDGIHILLLDCSSHETNVNKWFMTHTSQHISG